MCKELLLVPTAILNLGSPNFDVSESIGHFSLLACNLPLVSYSTECFPWVSTVFWIQSYVRELEQGMKHVSTWIHGPYSSGGKARLWSQTNFSYKILVPSFFSSCVTCSKLFHFAWTFFFLVCKIARIFSFQVVLRVRELAWWLYRRRWININLIYFSCDDSHFA